ncbi:MAG: NAD(P)-dependent oxidoreductase [Anaerolineaceae bacterium]
MKAFVTARITEKWLDELKKKFEIRRSLNFDQGDLKTSDLISGLQNCQVAVIENDSITREVLAQCPSLSAIVDFRGTASNIDIEAATKSNVVVINTPGRNANAVADLTVGLMIACARHISQGIDVIRQNQWVEKGTRWVYVHYQGYDLAGKTVGILGLGAIGRLVAKRLLGFDVNLVGYDPFVSPESADSFHVKWMPLDDVLKCSDIITIHIPMNDSTRNMLTERELNLMKPTAYLINTAREEIVNELALIKCLQEKKIAGLAQDVFIHEPIGFDHPLMKFPNVICTPHLGGASCDVIENQSQIGISNLFAFLSGENPKNCINPTVIPAAWQKISKDIA